ncbi:hypothetical protein ACSBR2_042506 [Camellia fascicularis]
MTVKPTVMSSLSYFAATIGEEVTNGENGEMVYNLLLKYGSGGTLADLIKKSGGCGLPESDVRYYTRSLLRGLNHIHQCGYVHYANGKASVGWEGHELPKVPSEVSKEGREFLKSCFVRKSMYRLTAEMLLNHSFVEGLVQDDGEIEEGEEILVPDEVGLSFMLYETDEECSYSSSSDDCTFVSEELFLSSWSDEADEIDIQEFSGFAEEGTLEDQESTDTTSSIIAPALDDVINKSKQVSTNTMQQCPITFTIPAGV